VTGGEERKMDFDVLRMCEFAKGFEGVLKSCATNVEFTELEMCFTPFVERSLIPIVFEVIRKFLNSHVAVARLHAIT